MLKSRHIWRFSAPKSPQQNRVVERLNIIIVEAARKMPWDANCQLEFGKKSLIHHATFKIEILSTIVMASHLTQSCEEKKSYN